MTRLSKYIDKNSGNWSSQKLMIRLFYILILWPKNPINMFLIPLFVYCYHIRWRKSLWKGLSQSSHRNPQQIFKPAEVKLFSSALEVVFQKMSKFWVIEFFLKRRQRQALVSLMAPLSFTNGVMCLWWHI